MRIIQGLLTSLVFVLLGAIPAAGQASAPSQAAMDDIVRIYCEAWGEPDVAKRRQMLQHVWADDASYTDPVSDVAGREALVSRISSHLQKFPGSRIVPASHADVHHGMLRFAWKFVVADGKVQTEGVDFAEITSDGRLKKVVGFFGSLKPLP
jgi:hypothetical protein